MIIKLIRKILGSTRFFMIFMITAIYIFLIPKDQFTFAIYTANMISWLYSEHQRKA